MLLKKEYLMPNSSIKLSIIIPMYKVAHYVERCIRSLTNQDIPFEDYEIICVNDGSPDNCAEIVMKLQKEIPNIVLINQENQGVSMARNNALAIAKGKYMMPIDPDDYVVPNCFKSVLEQADDYDLDVLYCAFEIYDVNHQSIWRTDYSKLINSIDNGYDGYFAVRGPKVKDPDRSWAMLYKMNLLREYQIDYPKDVPFLEDGLFLGKVFAVAVRVGYSDRDFYQRTTRPGSATNSELFHSERAIHGFLFALEDLTIFKQNSLVDKKLLDHLVGKFSMLALHSFCERREYFSYSVIAKRVKVYTEQINTIYLKYNYKRMVKLFNFSSLLFYISFRIIK
jgi:glycosyltransferase involved in cell wall biosynthesis